jgi:hypothetical protein
MARAVLSCTKSAAWGKSDHVIGGTLMSKPTLLRRTCVLAVVATLTWSSAEAANTLQNSNFDSALAPFWTLQLSAAPDPAGAGAVSRNASQDVTGNPASGAAEVDLAAAQTASNDAVSVVQCAPIPGGPLAVNTANYGARIKVPVTGNPSDGSINAQVEIRFFSDAACATFIPGAGGSQGRNLIAGVADDAFWYTAGDANFVPPPATVAASAQIRATLRRVSKTAAPSLAYFDSVFLLLNGSTPVTLQSFDVE